MSLLSYNRLVELVESGVINANPANISGASIDITLGDKIMVEANYTNTNVIDLSKKENINMREVDITDGYQLTPGQFILASSVETFNLPNNIAAEYKLKSSMARNGLQHLLAGWCDPTWNNSKLTLELKNVLNTHSLIIRPGMKIGQMVFWECEPVPDEFSYAKNGQYNGQTSVTESRGIK